VRKLGEDKKEVAERLFAFEFEGRQYSLVRMLEPFILVGKEDPSGLARQILLTPEEAVRVTPKLNELCKEDFENLINSRNLK